MWEAGKEFSFRNFAEQPLSLRMPEFSFGEKRSVFWFNPQHQGVFPGRRGDRFVVPLAWISRICKTWKDCCNKQQKVK
jgi:hypothetical protein